MSILDGLRNRRSTFSSAWYNAALDDVREALLNPTDEQREAAGKALWQATRLSSDPEWEGLDLGLRRIYEKEACAVLAAAAAEVDQ